VTRPWRVIMGPAEYCTTILLPKPLQNLPRVSLLDLGIPDCRLFLDVLNTQNLSDVGNSVKDYSFDHIKC
jgi:hypothetical protein